MSTEDPSRHRSQVRKGEKGIAILAPCVYRTKLEPEDDPEPRELRSLRGFRVAHVFDIAQTEGESLEGLEAVRPRLLEGEAPAGMWAGWSPRPSRRASR